MVGTIAAATGIQLFVEGFPEFFRILTSANSLVEGFGKRAESVSGPVGLFSRALDFVGDSMRRIFEIATGILVAQVFQRIADAISSIAAAAFDAAAQFQLLRVRLEGLIARDMITPFRDFAGALELAVPQAQDLFKWIKDLGILSPFTVQDVANVLTLAKSYGFATDMAKKLTDATQNFAAGMGLGNLEMKRIIENLGQMVQQQKITGFEVRDLARGAFVPVADVLKLTAMRLGMVTGETAITNKAINDFAKSRGLDAVQAFAESFIELVDRDFPGAAERMSLTFAGLQSNIKDFVEATLGFTVLGPAFDTLTARAAEFFQAFVGDPRIQKFFEFAGEGLNNIVTTILDNFPTAEGLVDAVATAFNRIRVAIGLFAKGETKKGVGVLALALGIPKETIERLKEITQTILDFRQGFAEGGLLGGLAAIEVPEGVLDFLENLIGFFQELAQKAPGFIAQVVAFVRDTLIPALQSIAQWVIDHRQIILGFFALFLLGTATITALASVITGLIGVFAALVVIAVGAIQAIIIALASLVVLGIAKIAEFRDKAIKIFFDLAKQADAWGKILVSIIKALAPKMKTAGIAIIQGLAEGIIERFNELLDDAKALLGELLDLVSDVFGLGSPSKVFAKFGVDIMAGLAAGLAKGMTLPIATMEALAAAFPGSSGIAFAGGGGVSNVTNVNISMQPTFNNLNNPLVLVDDVLALLATVRS